MRKLQLITGQLIWISENEYSNIKTSLGDGLSWVEMDDSSLLNLTAGVLAVFVHVERPPLIIDKPVYKPVAKKEKPVVQPLVMSTYYDFEDIPKA